MMTCGQAGLSPRFASSTGCRAVGTSSTLKPIPCRRSVRNFWAPSMPALNCGSAETLPWRTYSLSFSTGSNMPHVDPTRHTALARKGNGPIQNGGPALAAGPRLMLEVPDAGEDHGHAALVGGLDHFLVAHRTAGLDRRGRAGVSGRDQAIGKGKERFA